ncbi:hypothetical protein [Cellulomonas sp. P5_E12]
MCDPSGRGAPGGSPTGREVTIRTGGRARRETDHVAPGGLLVGAGAVLDSDQVDATADAGVSIVVSRGRDRSVVERARERGLLPVPGVATATALQAALKLALGRVRFFPPRRRAA